MGATVDFWDHSYYKLTKTLTSLVGQWPYQTTRELIIRRTLTFAILSYQIIPQILALRKYRQDMEIILATISPLIVDIVLFMKIFNNFWHFRALRHLLDEIRKNWTIFPRNNGLQMLHYYSDFGRKFSLAYLAGLYYCSLSYSTEPLQTRAIYTLLYPNTTLERVFAMPMDFGSIDLEKWYYLLLIGSVFSIVVMITILGSCDLLLFMCAEHACGLFKGLGYAIEHLPPYDKSEKGDYSFEYMRSCAMIHSRAIDFAEHIRDIYLWSFFVVIGLNTVIMSITAVEVVIHFNSMEKALKYSIFGFAQMAHLFIECLAAQRLMDASFDLKETLTNAKWYDASKNTQKLIPLMLIRSQSPIVLTAGKIIVMSMDTYAVVLKTAASYFTVFLAMQ